MTQYFSISGASGLVKVNSENKKMVQNVCYTSSIIDFIYEIDEDGELRTDSNEIIKVRKGDIVLKLYGKMVNGSYNMEGRTHVIVNSDNNCDMSLFVKMLAANEARSRGEYGAIEKCSGNYCSDSEAEESLCCDYAENC